MAKLSVDEARRRRLVEARESLRDGGSWSPIDRLLRDILDELAWLTNGHIE